MHKDREVQFRSLPRGNGKTLASRREANSLMPYALGLIMLVAAVGIGWVQFKPSLQAGTTPLVHTPKMTGSTDLASANSRVNTTINGHLQDAEIKGAIQRMNREVENMQFSDARFEPNDEDVLHLPDMQYHDDMVESAQKAAQTYEELNGPSVGYSGSMLPVDKINARIAERKWLNEYERAEKIQFVRNFIRSAHDQGYDVEINQDLVVVGIRRSNALRQVNIEQVLDNLAKQNL
jgi:hypothetical protein